MIKFIVMFVPLLALFAGQIAGFQPVLTATNPVGDEVNRRYSENRQYYAEFEYATGTPEFVPIARFQLFDPNGKAIYSIPDFQHTIFAVGNTGMVIGVDFDGPVSGRARLTFYDPAGRPGKTADIGFLLDQTFTRDGLRYGVNDGSNGVRIFDSEGEELYNLGPANQFALSSDGRIAVLARDTDILIYENGKFLRRVDRSSPFIRCLRVSSEGQWAGYADRKVLFVMDVKTGETLIDYTEADKQLNFISFDICDRGPVIIAGFEQDKGRGIADRHTRGMVRALVRGGAIVWEAPVNYRDWNIHVPQVSIGPDNTFSVLTDHERLVYGY